MTELSIAQWHQRFKQQAAWTSSTRRFLLEKAALSTDARVLEIGCGTGAVLTELAQEFPNSIGIDINHDYLRWFREHTPTVLSATADAYRLPYRAESFDLVCCHFFILWIDDPKAVIQEALRVLSPGGFLMIFAEPDYGGRIDHPPALQALGEAQSQSLADQGADPNMGRKLAGLAAAFPRLTIIEFGMMGYQHQLHEKTRFWEQEWEILIDDIGDDISPALLDELRTIDRQAREDGSRVLFVPTFYLYAELGKD